MSSRAIAVRGAAIEAGEQGVDRIAESLVLCSDPAVVLDLIDEHRHVGLGVCLLREWLAFSIRALVTSAEPRLACAPL